ncbi:hypothetical protein Pyn_16389 [Prunus yedoensis var. nudiflora]|uniref:RNase H type-1 domain-containing protein n=1 Tax=Prunus yedoensis var. nudiflora TaxID=2094558 RepID=A0A314V0H6_PRUYE|nr:hypothetical protein Pyn_16389 [Prunus yedoensis var. nudiflora]
MSEVQAIRRALEVVTRHGWRKVIVESDAEVLIEALHGKPLIYALLRGLLHDIRALSRKLVAVSFALILQYCNMASFPSQLGQCCELPPFGFSATWVEVGAKICKSCGDWFKSYGTAKLGHSTTIVSCWGSEF